MHLSPLPLPLQWLRPLSILGWWFVAVDPLLIVAPIVLGGFVFGPFLLLSTLCPSGVAITFMGNRELVTLL